MEKEVIAEFFLAGAIKKTKPAFCQALRLIRIYHASTEIIL